MVYPYKLFIIGFFACFLFVLPLTTTTYAQTSDTVVQDRLFLENVAKFKEWRRNIPDYEKRLYDRIKKINKRVIRLQNMVIGSFFLMLLFNVFFLVAILKLIKRRQGL